MIPIALAGSCLSVCVKARVLPPEGSKRSLLVMDVPCTTRQPAFATVSPSSHTAHGHASTAGLRVISSRPDV